MVTFSSVQSLLAHKNTKRQQLAQQPAVLFQGQPKQDSFAVRFGLGMTTDEDRAIYSHNGELNGGTFREVTAANALTLEGDIHVTEQPVAAQEVTINGPNVTLDQGVKTNRLNFKLNAGDEISLPALTTDDPKNTRVSLEGGRYNDILKINGASALEIGGHATVNTAPHEGLTLSRVQIKDSKATIGRLYLRPADDVLPTRQDMMFSEFLKKSPMPT